jgi:hypothetical protein
VSGHHFGSRLVEETIDMKGRPTRKKPLFKLCQVCNVKVFADYPYCEKHKEIYEVAKMRKRQMQEAG